MPLDPEDLEPIFTLKARDEFAPTVIRCWIKMAVDQGVNQDKIASAVVRLREFERFQEAHPILVRRPD